MSYRARVRDLLLADGAVAAIVDTRIYALRAPATVVAPYILLSTLAHTIQNTLRGPTLLENVRVRCDLYGSNYNELVGDAGLADAVMAAMAGSTTFESLFVFGTELYEDDTKFYHVVLDFSVWNDR